MSHVQWSVHRQRGKQQSSRKLNNISISLYLYFKKKERERRFFKLFYFMLSLTFFNVHNFLQDVLIRTLTSDEIKLNPIDAEDPEVSSYTYTFIS